MESDIQPKITTVVLKWNHDTMALSVECPDVTTVGFVQMLLDEAQRKMEETRRKSAIESIKRELANNALTDNLFRRGDAIRQ